MARQIYPSTDSRPMADIDLLVEPAHADTVRSVLQQMGYRDYHSPHVDGTGRDHHGAPLRHPDKGLWVEVHTALFPSDDPMAQVFAKPNDKLETRSFANQRFGVLPLTESFLYVLAHWAQLPQPQGKFHGLIDLALMLRQHPQAMVTALNQVQHRQLARYALLVAGLLQRCGGQSLLQGLDWPRLYRVGQFDRFRCGLMVRMAYQLTVRETGAFALAGRHLCSQWWRDVMTSRSRRDAVCRMLKRIFVPHDYGGLRGWPLYRRRLHSFWRRLRGMPSP